MSFTKIWIHAVWATRNHYGFLDEINRKDLFSHIREYAEKNRIEINFMNGVGDHVHCLIRLSSDQSICGVIRRIKGESSRWINLNKLTRGKFAWAVEYFAGSVSESAIEKVRDYIRNQEEHHRKKTFREEYELFMERYGLKPIGAGAGSGAPD
jgi:putative transposase